MILLVEQIGVGCCQIGHDKVRTAVENAVSRCTAFITALHMYSTTCYIQNVVPQLNRYTQYQAG